MVQCRMISLKITCLYIRRQFLYSLELNSVFHDFLFLCKIGICTLNKHKSDVLRPAKMSPHFGETSPNIVQHNLFDVGLSLLFIFFYHNCLTLFVTFEQVSKV